MKTKRTTLSCFLATILFAGIVGLSFTVNGQQIQTGEAQQLQRVESPPPFGTFYSSRTGIPYPFDPSFGKAAVYQWKPGVYIVDDSQGENANGMMTADGGGAMMMSMPSPCDPCATNSEPSEPITCRLHTVTIPRIFGWKSRASRTIRRSS